MVKQALERFYMGKCDVYEYKDVVVDFVNTNQLVLKHKDIPCRLSYNAKSVANQSVTTNDVTQIITLFLQPDITLPPGSVVTVTQNNITKAFKNSGIAAVYTTHQEVNLQEVQVWA